jgi:di/tricarboxylate transporter
MSMANDSDTFAITIRKRSRWFWALAGLWLLLEFLLLQTAIASMAEGERRAAAISWIAIVVLAVAGIFAWLRPEQAHKQDEPNGQLNDALALVEHRPD